MNRLTAARVTGISFGIFTMIIVALSCTGTKPAAEPTAESVVTQLSFNSPDEAMQSLVAAMRARDTAKLDEIFGPDSEDLLFSGDPVDDQLTFDRFLDAYDQKHQLVPNDQGGMSIFVGTDDWPMPIPIVKDDSGKGWQFDTANGKDEVITRRIGRNELFVIEVCKAVGDAEREYAQQNPTNEAIPVYARKFISDPGKKNGLYWPTEANEPLSPLGASVAAAQGEGYFTDPNSSTGPRPYHGYLYRIVTAQGASAPGGAMDYVINDKLIGGYAVVAWPVNYGSSGIMTFITNYNGDVYQKDLGDDTDKLARALTEYNPDSSWKKAE